MSIRALWNRLLDRFRRDRLAREMEEELHFHQSMLERDAALPAERRLGNLTRLREEVRSMWGFARLEVVEQDLRYALRGLRRNPAFTATVIITLGLGIGANAAMFGVVDRLIFRPLAYLREPSQVSRVYLASTNRGRESIGTSFEYTRYLDLKRWSTSFSQAAAFAQRPWAVGTGESAKELQVATVSASFFGFFNAIPERGRFFVEAEDVTPRGADVAVISHAFWRSEYGGREDIVGRTLQVGNILCTIIGVAPRGFDGVDDGTPASVFIPITTFAGSNADAEDAAGYYTTYNWGWMEMMVRRKQGVSLATASADLSNAYARSWASERALDQGLAPVAVGRPHALAGALRQAGGPDPALEAKTALWTTGVALIVLLIACANVANLLLARALRRRREIAVRLALGVSRRRLAAQCITESLVLALAGSVVGVAVAQAAGATLMRMFADITAPFSAFNDLRTLVFALAVAIAVGLLTGLAPALLGGRGELAATLKAGAREGTYHRSRTRSFLLVSQGALSVLLLVGAGLFVRSLGNVRALRLGFEPDPVLIVNSNLRGMKLSDTAQIALGRRLVAEAQATPGVEAASLVSSIPFWSTSSTSLFVTGIDSVQRLGRFTYQTGTPDYFTAIGTRILRGRAYTQDDRAGAPLVAVVSERMASVLWPGRDAIGQCMRLRNDTMPCTTVIGIAENAAQRSLTDDDGRLRYYLPLEQWHPEGGRALFLRMRGDPLKLSEGVRKRLQAVMPGQAYVTTTPMRDLLAAQQRSWQFGATMFVAFGGLALLVAAVGLYGVISYNVAQRTHELGVRVALGAQARDIARLVIGEGVRMAVIGAVAGCGLAMVLGRWVEPLLFHQSSRDPVVFGLVASLLLVVAMVATAVPARRASRADPNLALRAE